MAKDKTKHLSAHPKALTILAECVKQGLSDKKIQQRLVQECGYQWTLDTIGRRRRAMGVVKKHGKQVDVSVVDAPILTIAPPGLSDGERANWFRSQFKKTHLYKTIQRQFEPEEVEVYLGDFGLLCCQLGDIVISEFMQIDDFLKHRILIDRQLIEIKAVHKQIEDLKTWLMANPAKECEDKEEARFRVMHVRSLEDKYKHLKHVNERYDALVKERQKIYNGLAATRRDRLDELKGGKQTFLELVTKMQHSNDERDRQGRLAELTRIAAEDVKDNFRKPVKFPDGSFAPIIMDHETAFEEDDS